MKTYPRRNQSGYALLLAVLAFMGLSGAVAVGFTQQARHDLEQVRYLHNKRVLEEAKRALLQYAYNYPVTSGGTEGPGRLPCADTDNDGSSNPGACDAVGRFPWAELALGLNDLRDADGQRLWYTVSSSFAVNTSTIVNSDTSGTLTVRAPGGNVMYDGSNPDSLINYGIAAVIIAPGAAIDRNGTTQDRSAGIEDPFDTTADTEPGIINPVNYLDLVAGTEDNATVTQGGAVDGFVLGGNKYQSNENVNDQFILVTAEEVSAIAERAVLEAYQDAIDDYQGNVWASAANYRYPWLNAHADIIAIADLNIYDPDPLLSRRVGRVPYLNYYQDHDSHVVITDLQVDYDITLNSLADAAEVQPAYIDAFTAAFAGMFGARTLDITDSNLSFVKRTLDGTVDVDNDTIGTLVAQTTAAGSVVNASVNAAPGPITVTRFFWDGCATCIEPANGWELCNAPATNHEDCAKDIIAPHNFVAFAGATTDDFTPHADIRIRSVILQLQFDPDFEIQFDYTAAPTPSGWVPPTTADNARFVTTHNPALPNTLISIAATAQTDAKNFIDVNVLRCEQDNVVANAYNAFFLANDDAGTVSCLPPDLGGIDLQASVTYNLLNITADYYPELPYWVRSNGWNDSILMAYAADYQPVLVQAPPDCGTTPPCLTVTDDYAGETNNKASLLVGAGRIPANVGDLSNIFEGENTTPLDDVFAAHPNDGDDAMLILDDT
jgi:hypothetical protein